MYTVMGRKVEGGGGEEEEGEGGGEVDAMGRKVGGGGRVRQSCNEPTKS